MLRDGMLMCNTLGLSPILLESYLIIVVVASHSGFINNCWLTYVFRECCQLYSKDYEIVYGFCQKNMIAD